MAEAAGTSSTRDVDVLIVGAGFVGLACGAALTTAPQSDFVIVDQGSSVGSFWTGGHEHLSLHSPYHALPHDGGLAAEYPMFKTKREVCEYMEKYAAAHELKRRCRLEEKVVDVRRLGEGGPWRVETSRAVYRARRVVIASGLNREPHTPPFPGLAEHGKSVRHSWEVHSCAEYAGRRVLVLGSGNSAAEMAIALHRAGARNIQLIIDRPQHFVRRSTLGSFFSSLPWLGLSAATLVHDFHRLSFGGEGMRGAAWEGFEAGHDWLLRTFSVDLNKFSVEKPPAYAPPPASGEAEATEVAEARRRGFVAHRIPVYDVDDQRVEGQPVAHSGGVIDLIRSGAVRVRSATIQRFLPDGVVELKAPIPAFEPPEDTTHVVVRERYDAVILATGFRHGLSSFVADHASLLGPVASAVANRRPGAPPPQHTPLVDTSSRSTVDPSIYFVGFDPLPSTLSLGPALGYRGYDVGASIAHELYGTPLSRSPSLPASEQEGSSALGSALDMSPRHALGVLASGVAIGVVASLMRGRAGSSGVQRKAWAEGKAWQAVRGK